VDPSSSGDIVSKREATHIMWGYLKPIGGNNDVNIGTRKIISDESKEDEIVLKRCRLQLFKWQKDTWLVRRQAKRMGLYYHVPKVYLQYLRKHYCMLDSSLYISIGPTPRELHSRRIKAPEQIREGEKKDEIPSYDVNSSINLIRQFERLPEERCQIPDNILFRYDHKGALAASFSSTGEFLAVVSKSHQIHVLNLCTRETEYVSTRCHYEDIVDVVWSKNDSAICCASLDGTISIHLPQELATRQGSQFDTKCYDVLYVEPPSHPTSLSFFSVATNIPIIIVGLNDGAVGFYNLAREPYRMELLAGIRCHTKAVQAIEIDASNARIYTGDDNGKIVIWKTTSDNPTSGMDFEVLLQLDTLRETAGNPILYLSLYQSHRSALKVNDANVTSRKLLITIEKEENCLYLYDLESHELASFGILTETKQSAFKVAKFSPDGRFVFGAKDGKIELLDSSGIQKKVRQTIQNHYVINVTHRNSHHPSFLVCIR